MDFKPPFTGIHAIVYALFDAQERLNREAMRKQVEICLGLGVHGMAALGLATEVSKLGVTERRMVMEWVAEDTDGRVPLAFTIFGSSASGSPRIPTGACHWPSRSSVRRSQSRSSRSARPRRRGPTG